MNSKVERISDATFCEPPRRTCFVDRSGSSYPIHGQNLASSVAEIVMSATVHGSPTVPDKMDIEDKTGPPPHLLNHAHVLEEEKAPDAAGSDSANSIASSVQSAKTNLWILPIPSWRRYDPNKPVLLGLALNLLLAIGATIVVANLYWCAGRSTTCFRQHG